MPTLTKLIKDFGSSILINKQLALIPDARLTSRSDVNAQVVELFLSVSGEDAQSIERKFKDHWHGTLSVRFVLMMNSLPKLDDSSGALAGRFIILRLTRSFADCVDPDLTKKLLVELPGILNWSLDGLDRLTERGHFVQPASGSGMIDNLKDITSPIGAFIRTCCDLNEFNEGRVDFLFEAWQRWCQAQNHTKWV